MRKITKNDNLRIKKSHIAHLCAICFIVNYSFCLSKSFLPFLVLREWQKKKRFAPHECFTPPSPTCKESRLLAVGLEMKPMYKIVKSSKSIYEGCMVTYANKINNILIYFTSVTSKLPFLYIFRNLRVPNFHVILVLQVFI